MTGGPVSRLGVAAEVLDVYSDGSTTLTNLAHVFGDVHLRGSLERQAESVVDGEVYTLTTLPTDADGWTETLPQVARCIWTFPPTMAT